MRWQCLAPRPRMIAPLGDLVAEPAAIAKEGRAFNDTPCPNKARWLLRCGASASSAWRKRGRARRWRRCGKHRRVRLLARSVGAGSAWINLMRRPGHGHLHLSHDCGLFNHPGHGRHLLSRDCGLIRRRGTALWWGASGPAASQVVGPRDSVKLIIPMSWVQATGDD